MTSLDHKTHWEQTKRLASYADVFGRLRNLSAGSPDLPANEVCIRPALSLQHAAHTVAVNVDSAADVLAWADGFESAVTLRGMGDGSKAIVLCHPLDGVEAWALTELALARQWATDAGVNFSPDSATETVIPAGSFAAALDRHPEAGDVQ